MNFTCQPYIYDLIIVPTLQFLISVVILFVLIFNHQSLYFIKRCVKSRWFRRDNKLKLFQIIFGSSLCFFLLVSSFAPLRYGIPLSTEMDSDYMTCTGYVEHISKSAIGSMKYRGDVYYPCIIMLDGKKYFVLSQEGLEEGYYIKISYLPKSTVVLSFEVLNAQQLDPAHPPSINNVELKYTLYTVDN